MPLVETHPPIPRLLSHYTWFAHYRRNTAERLEPTAIARAFRSSPRYGSCYSWNAVPIYRYCRDVGVGSTRDGLRAADRQLEEENPRVLQSLLYVAFPLPVSTFLWFVPWVPTALAQRDHGDLGKYLRNRGGKAVNTAFVEKRQSKLSQNQREWKLRQNDYVWTKWKSVPGQADPSRLALTETIVLVHRWIRCDADFGSYRVKLPLRHGKTARPLWRNTMTHEFHMLNVTSKRFFQVK